MSDFERLLREFCTLSGLPDAEAIGMGSPIEVDGVTCSITPNRQRPDDMLVVYMEFGSVPTGRETEVYAELLAQNYLSSPDGGVNFGYSALLGRVICTQQLPTANLSAKHLADLLRHLATKALEWRKTFFLKTAEAKRQAPPNALSGGARALLAASRDGSRRG